MRQTGVVTALRNFRAEVKVLQHGACASCRQKCGLSSEIKEMRLEVLNPQGAQVGDRVIIELPDQQVLKAAMWVYVWPLLFLFLGVAVGAFYLNSEPYALLLGFSGLVLSFLAIKLFLEPKINTSNKYLPQIIGFSDSGECKERE